MTTALPAPTPPIRDLAWLIPIMVVVSMTFAEEGVFVEEPLLAVEDGLEFGIPPGFEDSHPSDEVRQLERFVSFGRQDHFAEPCVELAGEGGRRRVRVLLVSRPVRLDDERGAELDEHLAAESARALEVDADHLDSDAGLPAIGFDGDFRGAVLELAEIGLGMALSLGEDGERRSAGQERRRRFVELIILLFGVTGILAPVSGDAEEFPEEPPEHGNLEDPPR